MAFFRRKPPPPGNSGGDDRERYEEEISRFEFHLSTAQSVNVQGGGDFYTVQLQSGMRYPYVVHLSPEGATFLRSQGYSLQELPDDYELSLGDVRGKDIYPSDARFQEETFDTQPSYPESFSMIPDNEWDQMEAARRSAYDETTAAIDRKRGFHQPQIPPRGRRGPTRRERRPRQ